MRARDPDISHEEVLALFQYDASTGNLYWRKSPGNNSTKVGGIAGSVFYTKTGVYMRVTIRKKRVLAHRLVWFYVHGAWPEDCVDHRDGNGLNNRIDNLRLATKQQNCHHRKPIPSASGFRGVYRIKKKKESHNQTKFWGAKICLDWKWINLGCFSTKEEAIEARKIAEAQHYGEFAWKDCD